MNIEQWLKRLWLAIGVILLPLSVLLAGVLIYAWVDDQFGDEPTTLPVAEANTLKQDSLRAVRFGPPARVLSSTTRVVRVRYGRGDYDDGAGIVSGSALRYDNYDGPAINMIFLDSTGATSSLLLAAPGLITRSEWPDDPSDSVQTIMIFEVIERDTDGDGRLSPKDRATLVLTDLDGRNVRRPLPDSLYYESAVPDRGSTLLIYALEPAKGQDPKDRDNMRQRAFVYDPKLDRLAPHTALESSVVEAARLLKAPSR